MKSEDSGKFTHVDLMFTVHNLLKVPFHVTPLIYGLIVCASRETSD